MFPQSHDKLLRPGLQHILNWDLGVKVKLEKEAFVLKDFAAQGECHIFQP